MNYEISIWKGYPVHGDIKELDHIVESTGIINIDNNDVVGILTERGDNYVAAGINANLGEALKEVVSLLPCKIEKVNNLLIDFRFGSKQPNMAELSSITEMLSEISSDVDIIWGMSSEESLGESYKVVLVASVKA